MLVTTKFSDKKPQRVRKVLTTAFWSETLFSHSSDQGILVQNFWSKVHFLHPSDLLPFG